ncbi:MAG: corrinoid protein [Acetivibrionales bacterium]|nr:corrinoid protein [Bacillota bacterium]NLP07362.1 cobalamin-binding protein [Clostridiaceae bacterium]HOA54042.1 corrinoid protein [Clostridiales bacterium]HQD30222.1 corrinoid protein [Clostridiales bacterium]
METLNAISENLQKGKANAVKELVQTALEKGLSAENILNGGLLSGMDIIGAKFKNNEIYIPEVMIAARAMNAGMEILRPVLGSSGVKARGKIVIGTVKGDLHDIGKNLVKMMMDGKGIDVIDLGTDVSAERFIAAAVENDARIIACSALLTTTMPEMKKVVELLEERGLRDSITVMIGGAPVTESYRQSIGADIYTPDAASAAEEAAKVLG